MAHMPFISSASQLERYSGHFFDADTMRLFGSRLHSRIYPVGNGAYFVTSELSHNGSDRRYTVRFATVKIDDGGKIAFDIDIAGEFRQYATRSGAHAAARNRQMIELPDSPCERCGKAIGESCEYGAWYHGLGIPQMICRRCIDDRAARR